jgi:SAM-dependent methyltransferase
MNTTHDTASEQTALWNGAAGRAWVEAQQVLDRLFTPFEDLLVAAVRAASPRSVLDVGCGTGSTTLAVARALDADGRCLGIDLSEPMIALARARAARERIPAEFVCADAQVHAFEPDSVDMILSRVRRDVLRRSGSGLFEPAACRARGRAASVHRLAEVLRTIHS